MFIGPIGIDPDLVLDMIKRVTAALDEYPDPERIRETSGPAGDIAANFDGPLTVGARSVARQSESLREELVSLDAAIRATMKDFVGQDESAETDAKRFLAILDDAATPTPPAGSAGAEPNSTTPLPVEGKRSVRTNP